jgi:hypothetical protein
MRRRTFAPKALRSTPMLSSQRRHTVIEIKRIGSQPSVKGPSDSFTGTVRIDQPLQATDPAQAPDPGSQPVGS